MTKDKLRKIVSDDDPRYHRMLDLALGKLYCGARKVDAQWYKDFGMKPPQSISIKELTKIDRDFRAFNDECSPATLLAAAQQLMTFETAYCVVEALIQHLRRLLEICERLQDRESSHLELVLDRAACSAIALIKTKVTGDVVRAPSLIIACNVARQHRSRKALRFIDHELTKLSTTHSQVFLAPFLSQDDQDVLDALKDKPLNLIQLCQHFEEPYRPNRTFTRRLARLTKAGFIRNDRDGEGYHLVTYV